MSLSPKTPEPHAQANLCPDHEKTSDWHVLEAGGYHWIVASFLTFANLCVFTLGRARHWNGLSMSDSPDLRARVSMGGSEQARFT